MNYIQLCAEDSKYAIRLSRWNGAVAELVEDNMRFSDHRTMCWWLDMFFSDWRKHATYSEELGAPFYPVERGAS
ncbi:MAG: hypothetical protein NUV51_03985 [Sulfuricaulis sp.]|nr:hypothetical protein [Sulfuricaulis sp.]